MLRYPYNNVRTTRRQDQSCRKGHSQFCLEIGDIGLLRPALGITI
jgi:hypothetical protein